ncbi:MAG: PEGA domain-containing protein [Lacunisphaera sp.]|nr:PEGA domain-containing protein [Lacunisphaera sp.]
MDDLDLGATIKGFSAGQRIFNRYELKKILGRGGMGVVWLARDGELERDVALKFLPEVVALDPEAVRDMKRETRRSLELTHPNIIRIHDFVQDGRTAAISMEYVSGSTFTARKLDQPGGCFTAAELGTWAKQLCEALDYAHTKAEIVHRDLKPANLMIDARGDLKVADFGISASVSDSVSRVSKQAGSSGTPLYMSPQQMMGEDPAVADDIYSVGATLYELLTGKPPFHSGNIMAQVQTKVPMPVNERRRVNGMAAGPVPAAWEETVAACLAKEAADRPLSVAEVAERLGLVGATKDTKKAGAGAANGPKVERADPSALAQAQPNALGSARSTSRKPLYAALAAAVVVLAGAGYYFGSYVPEQKRLAEIKRLQEAGQAVEAAKLRNAQEKADVAAKEKADTDQQAFAVMAAKIDAVLDGAPATQQAATDQAVKTYLATAPARYKSEAEARWAKRSAGWETNRLSLARGGLRVRTVPEGAEVQIGSLALEKSPVTVRDVRLGKYPVLVRADGYEEARSELEVKENEFADPEPIRLVRSTGGLQLAGDPAGAGFSLRQRGGEGFGKTGTLPATLEGLPTGTYTVTARFPGLADVTREVAVARRAVASLDVRFDYGTLKVSSEPAGAEVRAGEKLLGVTPLTLTPFAAGSVDLTVRAKGHARQKMTDTVTTGQTLALSATLKKGGFDDPWELAESVLEEMARNPDADPELRAGSLGGIVSTLLQLGGVPNERLKPILARQFEAICAIPEPGKQLSTLAMAMDYVPQVDEELARRWTEQAVAQVSRITTKDDRTVAITWMERFWMFPTIADQAATTMESWFAGNDDDWVWLASVAKLHQRFGNAERARTTAARANGPYRKDSIDGYLRTASDQRRLEPIQRNLLKGDVAAARKQAAALVAPLDYGTTVDLAGRFIKAGDVDTARQLARVLESQFTPHFPGLLVTYALMHHNSGFAESVAAAQADAGDSAARSDAYRSLAEYYLRLGRKDQARAAAAQIRSFGNEQWGFGKQMAVPVLVAVGDLARARQIAQSVANPFEKEKVHLWSYHALMFYSIGDLNSYNRALQLNTGAGREQASDMFVGFQLIPLLCSLGRLEEAEKLLPQIKASIWRNAAAGSIMMTRLRATAEDDYDALVDAAAPGEARTMALNIILYLKLEKKQLASAGR